jgi:hypothetical protein
MTNRTQSGVLLLVLAAGLVGCNDGPYSPTAPSQQTSPPTSSGAAYVTKDVTLSGVVFELTPTGRVPIEGVGVSNGEGEYAVTDTNGYFSIRPIWVCPCSAQPWIAAGFTLLWLWTDDYEDPPGQPPSLFAQGHANPGPGWRDVMIYGDTRVDIQLVKR